MENSMRKSRKKRRKANEKTKKEEEKEEERGLTEVTHLLRLLATIDWYLVCNHSNAIEVYS